LKIKGERAKFIYITLYGFILLYPFLIYPWGDTVHRYFTMQKFFYLILFVIVLWTLFIIRWFKEKRFLEEPFSRGEKLMLVFGGFIAISTILSVDVGMSIMGTIGRFEGALAYFAYLSLFFLAFHFIQSDQYEKVFKTAIYGSGLASIYGILQHFRIDIFESAKSTRSSSFFDNPNFFGSYLVIMMMLAVTLFFASNRKNSGIYIFIIMLNFSALLYTSTRSGWLGVAFGLFFLTLFILFKRRDLWRRLVSLLIILGLLFTLINMTEKDSYLSRAGTIVKESGAIVSAVRSGDVVSGNENDRIGSGRWYIWKTTLPLVPKYLLTGSGPDTFILVFPQPDSTKQNILTKKVDKVHNEYLQILITLGLPALVVYLFLLYHIISRGIKTAWNLNGRNQILHIGLIITILGYLVQAFFNISVITVAPFLWILLAMLYRSSNVKVVRIKEQNKNLAV
jgi:O-antigen ligase